MSNWIPTKEGLPDDQSHVLTTIKIPRKGRIPKVRSGWYQDGLFMNDNGDTWQSTDKEVVAWMYSPKPYDWKEDGGEANN